MLNSIKEFSLKEYVNGLHIHFEDNRTVLRRTLISIAAIAAVSFIVFGIDTIVTSIEAMFM